MFCFIFKWMMSRSHDLDKSLSGRTARHIERCKECQDYFRSLQSLSTRLRWSVLESLQIPVPSLDKKIKKALVTKPAAPEIPRRRYHPVYTMAAGLVIILIATVILLQIIPEKIPEPDNPFIIEQFVSLDTSGALQDMVAGMESSFEIRIQYLEQFLKSTAQSMVSALNPVLYKRGNFN